MVKQQLIYDLRTFVANSTLSRLRAFGGALLAKIWWEGARKHFIRPGLRRSSAVSLQTMVNPITTTKAHKITIHEVDISGLVIMH